MQEFTESMRSIYRNVWAPPRSPSGSQSAQSAHKRIRSVDAYCSHCGEQLTATASSSLDPVVNCNACGATPYSHNRPMPADAGVGEWRVRALEQRLVAMEAGMAAARKTTPTLGHVRRPSPWRDSASGHQRTDSHSELTALVDARVEARAARAIEAPTSLHQAALYFCLEPGTPVHTKIRFQLAIILLLSVQVAVLYVLAVASASPNCSHDRQCHHGQFCNNDGLKGKRALFGFAWNEAYSDQDCQLCGYHLQTLQSLFPHFAQANFSCPLHSNSTICATCYQPLQRAFMRYSWYVRNVCRDRGNSRSECTKRVRPTPHRRRHSPP